MAAQLRKSAVSVESNLAEGAGRYTDADLARFLDIAAGSLTELEVQLLIAYDVGLLADARPLCAEVRVIRKMIHRLSNYLRGATATDCSIDSE